MSQSRLYLTARKPEAMHIASILDPVFEEEGLPSAVFVDVTNESQWIWSVYIEREDADRVRKLIGETLGGDNFGLEIQEETLGEVDWVAATLRDLAPVTAGRFFVHGSHDRAAAANKRLPIEIDAGLAFGTGHHGTTAGCLDMLERVLKLTSPRNAMDIGTGSGVLAIALAKATRIPVLGTDIDPVSTRVAKENSQLNGTASQTRFETAAGFNHPAFAEFGQTDLILANILARPLEQLARAMSLQLLPGANVILSGLLPHQQARIVAAYRQQGLVLKQASVRDNWLTLWLNKP